MKWPSHTCTLQQHRGHCSWCWKCGCWRGCFG